MALEASADIRDSLHRMRQVLFFYFYFLFLEASADINDSLP
jgi:hypothetical protein